MKSNILNLLKKNGKVVSGEILSAHLGISRVSVWKHIRKLRELGYRIESTPKGYRLVGAPDTPYSWEFPGRENRMHYFPEVTSTMTVARDMARSGCPHLTVVVADRQTGGRGRLQRRWLSDQGGLYFTVVLRPEIPIALTTRLNFLASLVLARTLQQLFHIDAGVKWPNDILVKGKKLSGMLSEMEAEADLVTFVNIGIGVNVNNDPTAKEPGATSLKKLTGKASCRRELLAHFLDAFEKRLDPLSLDTVISEWKGVTVTLNQPVRVVTRRETVEGVALDLDESGALILQLPDGSLKKIVSGDCFQ